MTKYNGHNSHVLLIFHIVGYVGYLALLSSSPPVISLYFLVQVRIFGLRDNKTCNDRIQGKLTTYRAVNQ